MTNPDYRALLDQPLAEGPTDEELADLMPTRFLVNQSASARAIANIGTDEQVAEVRAILDGEAIAYARAVLARWGRPAAAPAPLTDLAARLISESKPMDPEIAKALTPEARWDLYEGPAAPAAPEAEEGRWSEGICGDGAAILFDGVMVPIEEVVRALNRTRAATLLQQQAAPVPVSELGEQPVSQPYRLLLLGEVQP